MYSSLPRGGLVASRSEVKAILVRATPRYWVKATMSSEAMCAKDRGLSARPGYRRMSMTCLPSTEKTRTSRTSSPPVTWARVITRMFAPTERQSSKFGFSGLSGGRAAKRLSGTNWKRPSNLRSLRRTWVMVRQASRLASSPARGMQSGTANRCPPLVMMIWLFAAGACADPDRADPTARSAAVRARAILGCGLEEGLDGDSVRAIGLGKQAKRRRRKDGAQRGVVEQLYPAALRDADRIVRQTPVGQDRQGDGDGLGEAALDLSRPDHPDLLLHGGEVPVAGGVAPVRRTGTGRADDAHASGRDAGAGATGGRLGGRSLRSGRAGVARWGRLLGLGLRPLRVGKRQSLARLLLRGLDHLWRRRGRRRLRRGLCRHGRGRGGCGLGRRRPPSAAWKRDDKPRNDLDRRAPRTQPGSRERAGQEQQMRQARHHEAGREAAVHRLPLFEDAIDRLVHRGVLSAGRS